MKKLQAILIVTVCGLAAFADTSIAIPGPGMCCADISTADAEGWKFRSDVKETTDCIAELSIVASTTDEKPRNPPKFTVSFSVPQIDAWHRWSMESEKVTMPPDWRSALEPRLCFGFPLVAFLGGDDRNRLAVAVSESKRKVRIDAGLRERITRVSVHCK